MESVKFELTYAALKLFGKQLYSNSGSAISELVANGLDAKANKIYLVIDVNNREHISVEILDNGEGMSYDDIKEKYIKIGYNKRKNSSDSNDKLLGRKGIGKLAALYLSDCFTVATKKKGTEAKTWKLDISDIEDDKNPQLDLIDNSIPENMKCRDLWLEQDSGTYIFLENVELGRFGPKSLEALESRLSNYFLYDELNTNIMFKFINDNSILKDFEKVEKRVAFNNMVCIFTNDVSKLKTKEQLEGSSFSLQYTNKLGVDKEYFEELELNSFNSILNGEEKGVYEGVEYELKGWMGIHSTIDKEIAVGNDSRYIKNQFYSPNQLRVYVRNKLGMVNMIEHLGITRAFGNYIEGEIVFDILDDNRFEDIAGAGRQDFDIHDGRFIILKELTTKIGNMLVSKRQKLANRISEQKKIEDLIIASNAKNIFKEELQEEIEAVADISETDKTNLEMTLFNKIEGDEKLVVKSHYTVFLSHASKDKIFSDFIYTYLCSKGFKGNLSEENCEIFYSSSGLDTDNLEPLSKVIKDILISKNNDILFFTSENFKKSEFCLFEGGAAWATRSIKEFKIISLSHESIPTFLTNGRAETILNIKSKKDFELDGMKYNSIVKIINRLIGQLNKNRKVKNEEMVDLLEVVSFPNKLTLKRLNKQEKDYMDQELLEYWNTYVFDEADQYIKDNSLGV